MAAKADPRLYGNAGVADGLDPKLPLQITEKDHRYRNASACECHDCGFEIAKGEAMVVSAIQCLRGVHGKSHRYNIHEACYAIVGRVVMLLGKEATHTFEGRPSLRDLWKQHHVTIKKGSKELYEMLLKGLGKP